MPRVSVIIPTFNLARYIGRTLDSVFAQTYKDFEVIVADDGSTDDTQQELHRFAGRLHYLHQANRGVAAARNLALSKATGELIAYVDADDMWYPQKLQRQIDFLDTHKNCGVVHSDTAIIDDSDGIVWSRFNQQTHRDVPQGRCLTALLRHCHIQQLTVMERRECVKLTGGYDERLRGVDDYMRWILLAIEGVEFGYIDEPLALYRWRAGQFGSTQNHPYMESFVNMFELLLKERDLRSRCGEEAAAIARDRLYSLRYDLAYLHRAQGRTDLARRNLAILIQHWPLRAELYVALLKSCVPAALAGRLRKLKQRLT